MRAKKGRADGNFPFVRQTPGCAKHLALGGKVEAVAGFDLDGADPLESVVLGEEQDAVRSAFARLSERDRELLELRVVAGLSAEEVASVLDMRPGAVRTAQSRALERLRGLLLQVEEVGS